MTGTPWGSAIADMASAGGLKNKNMNTWLDTLNAISNNMDIIQTEQLISKARAMKRMQRFRWKKSFIDQRLKVILKPAWRDGKMLNLGMGDVDFPCTGKGELAVPTTDLQKSLKRVIRMMNISRKVKIVPIDEYNTTKCCHCCGTVMQTLTTPSGQECLRYRVCNTCTCLKTPYKRRHRDVNASKNILKILQCLVNGHERPEYLRNPWRRN
jgi:hypothetical protein